MKYVDNIIAKIKRSFVEEKCIAGKMVQVCLHFCDTAVDMAELYVILLSMYHDPDVDESRRLQCIFKMVQSRFLSLIPRTVLAPMIQCYFIS